MPAKKTTTGQDTSEWDRGYRGEVPDPTPNEAYTVHGVTSGARTPETQEPGTPGSTKTDPEQRVRPPASSPSIP